MPRPWHRTGSTRHRGACCRAPDLPLHWVEPVRCKGRLTGIITVQGVVHEKQSPTHHVCRSAGGGHAGLDDRHPAHAVRRGVRRRAHPAVLHAVRRCRRGLRPDRPHRGGSPSGRLGRRGRAGPDPRHHGRRDREPYELGIQPVPGRARQGRGIQVLPDVPDDEHRLSGRRHRGGAGRHLPPASGPAVHPLHLRREDPSGVDHVHPAAGRHRHRLRAGLGVPDVDLRPDGRLARQLHPPRRGGLRRQGSRLLVLHDSEDLRTHRSAARGGRQARPGDPHRGAFVLQEADRNRLEGRPRVRLRAAAAASAQPVHWPCRAGRPLDGRPSEQRRHRARHP